MRAMKDSGYEWLQEVPKEWKLERLQWHLVELVEKNDPIKTTQVLSLTNKKGVIPYEEKGNQGNNAKESYDGYKIAYPDTIVANSMNILIGSVGYSNYYGCVSPVYYVFKEKEGNELRFINYLMQIPQFQKELRKFANGILEIRLRVSSSDILKRVCAFPQIDEQRRIADYLDSKCSKIDAIIANQEQIVEKLKAYKLSVITEAVTKGLDPSANMKDSKYEYIGDVPTHWDICRLRNIGTLQNGLSKGGEFFGEGYPFVSYGDIYRNYTLPESVSGLVRSSDDDRKNYSVEEGDIFFTRTSETIEEVGFSCVCEKTIPDATFAGFVIRVRPFNDKLLTRFAKYYFRSEHQRLYLAKEMNLVTRASLSQDLLKSMPVLVPPMVEQIEIADYLDKKCEAIDESIRKKELLVEKLLQYKKSLIYEVVTGKKEV